MLVENRYAVGNEVVGREVKSKTTLFRTQKSVKTNLLSSVYFDT
jgi:hypothetical protein